MNAPARKLLILDIDETLVHARVTPLERDEDFCVGEYFIYRRPGLDAFVAAMLEAFDVAVWTSSGESYAEQVLQRIFPAGALKFVWSSRRRTTHRDWETGEPLSIKNLTKLRRRGYALETVIAVDDTPAKYLKSYGNLVTVREYVGDPADDELPLLARYLHTLLPVENVRAIEKRGWRERMRRASGPPIVK